MNGFAPSLGLPSASFASQNFPRGCRQRGKPSLVDGTPLGIWTTVRSVPFNVALIHSIRLPFIAQICSFDVSVCAEKIAHVSRDSDSRHIAKSCTHGKLTRVVQDAARATPDRWDGGAITRSESATERLILEYARSVKTKTAALGRLPSSCDLRITRARGEPGGATCRFRCGCGRCSAACAPLPIRGPARTTPRPGAAPCRRAR